MSDPTSIGWQRRILRTLAQSIVAAALLAALDAARVLSTDPKTATIGTLAVAVISALHNAVGTLGAPKP